MNVTITLLSLFAVIVPLLTWFFFKNKVNLQIFPIIGAISIALIFGAVYASRSYQTSDIEIWNGQVISKNSERVSCEHSYSCNCRESCSGSGSSRSCSTTCDTCYDHSYDVDWLVHSTAGDLKIDRVNRRGDQEPPRFTHVKAGDPVAIAKSYTNWVKAVPNSLFSKQSNYSPTQFAGMIPAYPSSIYDYHYVDRVIPIQVPLVDVAGWNRDLALMLRPIGPARQANVVIIMVKTTDPNYEYALQHAWEGGKKNDVVVVLGITEYPKITWVRIVSWTDKQLFKVKLRDDLLELGTVQDRSAFLKIVSDNVSSSYVRKRMRDFEYLSNEITPPNWMIILLICLIVAANVGAVFGTRSHYGNYRY